MPESEWTIGTLKAHLDAILHDRDERYAERFSSQEKSVDTALAAAEKAVTKAETATEKRFDGVNEFRQTLSDQAREFMPRKEMEGIIGTMMSRLVAVERFASAGAGKDQGSDVMFARSVSTAAVLVAIASMIALALKK